MNDFIQEVKVITENSSVRTRLFLVKNGIPFDVAFSLDEVEATAWQIMFGEMEGGKFDYDLFKWVERK